MAQHGDMLYIESLTLSYIQGIDTQHWHLGSKMKHVAVHDHNGNQCFIFFSCNPWWWMHTIDITYVLITVFYL